MFDVKYQEITLGPLMNKVELQLPDSKTTQISYKHDKKDEEENLFISNGQSELKLKSIVDLSEALHSPRVFVASGKRQNIIFIFGGTTSYWIDDNLHIKDTLILKRDLCEVEFWSTTVNPVTKGLLVIYEGGMFLLDSSLNLLWHQKKLFNDRLGVIGPDSFILRSDEGETEYSFETGLSIQ
jgi:hypothetical protein